MKRIVVYILSVLLLSPTLSAQLTIDDYRSSVEAYSLTLGRADAAVEGADAQLRRQRKGRLPSVVMRSDIDLVFRDKDNERQWSWNRRTEVNQTLYAGGGVRADIKRSELEYDIAEYSVEQAQRDVVYEAEQAYWELSRAEVYHEAIADYISIIRKLRDIVAHRFEEGYTSKNDLLQVESRMSDAEYQLSAAKQDYLLALHNFNVLRGVEPSHEVVLYNSILDSMVMPVRRNIDYLLSSHPEYAISKAEREVARWGIRSAGAKYLPSMDLSLYGFLQPNTPHRAGGGMHLDGGVVLSMNTPIFHFRERREAVREAESNYRISELNVESMVDKLSLMESNGWTNLQTIRSRIDASQRNLALAEENLSISTYAYGEGSVTILDVLQAQISWLQIYTNAIMARYDYALAVAAYRRITGDL